MNSGGKPGDAPAPVKSDKPSGEIRMLGRYQIEKKLGSGGMGTVYKATDTRLKRTVALKVLPRDKAKNPILVKRFEAEAQAAAHLRHDNIIGIYDSGELEGYLFIAMEFVDGADAHELVHRDGPFSVDASTRIIRQIVLALDHAYEQQIVHRDIKPSNLLITADGLVKLVDMGLARCVTDSEEAGITRVGTTVGTIDYMPPEQARDSRSTDCRSDIYSLGATWYHLLTGRPPFPTGDLLNKITAHATQPPPHPSKYGVEVSESLWRIILRMMAKEPGDRFQTPKELLHAIDHPDEAEAASEISLDLLAALGDDAEAAGGSKKSRRPKVSDASGTPDLLAIFEEDDDLPSVKAGASKSARPRPDSAESVRRKEHGQKDRQKSVRSEAGDDHGPSAKSKDAPKTGKKSREKSAKGERGPVKKDSGEMRSAARAETRADMSTTQSAIPSARDVALSRHLKKNSQMAESIKVGIILAIVIGAIVFVWMQMSGSDASSAPANSGSGTTPAKQVEKNAR